MSASTTGGIPRGRVVALLTVLAKGLALGTVLGMNTFLFVKQDATPAAMPSLLPVVFIVVLGVCTGLLVPSARRGFPVAMVAMGTGFVVDVAAWLLPLVMAGLDPFTAKLLGVAFTGRAFLTALLVLPLSYLSGYFAVLVAVAYLGE